MTLNQKQAYHIWLIIWYVKGANIFFIFLLLIQNFLVFDKDPTILLENASFPFSLQHLYSKFWQYIWEEKETQ